VTSSPPDPTDRQPEPPGPPAPGAPEPATESVGPTGIDGLEAWVASIRVEDAARTRSRRHWLERQAEEEASIAGVLVDLAERGHPVVLALRHGRRLRGRVQLVGSDVVALRTPSGQEVLVRSSTVSWITAEPGSPPVRGARALRTRATFAEALRELAAVRPRVTVVTTGGDTLVGVLRGVGTDLAVLRLDGDGGEAYVALYSLAEVSPTASG
jgi:small nuclear ribonucleoprotein (snRNP)-like protein